MKVIVLPVIAFVAIFSHSIAYPMENQSQIQRSLILAQQANQHRTTAYIAYLSTFSPRHKMIVLHCKDGSVQLKPWIAYQCKTLKNAIVDSDPNTNNSVVDLTIFNNTPTRKTITQLYNCINGSQKLTTLSNDKLLNVFIAADMLEAPKKTRQTLAEHILKIIPKNKIDKELYLQICSNLPKSIKSLIVYGNNPAWLERAADNNFIVDLAGKDLETLDGLGKIGSRKVKIIDISNNKLKSLELDKITKAFPNVAQVTASNNKIKQLTRDDLNAFPNGLRLFLDDNQISSIEKSSNFNAPANAYLDLTENNISPESLENLKKSLAPSWCQRNRKDLFRQLGQVSQFIIDNKLKLGFLVHYASIGCLPPFKANLWENLIFIFRWETCPVPRSIFLKYLDEYLSIPIENFIAQRTNLFIGFGAGWGFHIYCSRYFSDNPFQKLLENPNTSSLLQQSLQKTKHLFTTYYGWKQYTALLFGAAFFKVLADNISTFKPSTVINSPTAKTKPTSSIEDLD